jgi:hypothetical protein
MIVERTDSERLAVLETKVDAIHEDLHSIWQSLRELAGRPSWTVAVLVTLLSSLVCGLAVAVLVR